MALPVALAVIMVVSGLAIGGSPGSQSPRTTRPSVTCSVKRATQAASAGLQALRYQMNLLQPPSTQCVLKDATTGALSVAATQADGWCDPQTEDLGDGAGYTARISSANEHHGERPDLLSRRRIVSIGSADGVQRRVALIGECGDGKAPLFAPGYAITSLQLDRLRQQRPGRRAVSPRTATSTLRNWAEICGPVTPGPGKTLTLYNSASVCGNFSTAPAQQDFQLQPVDLEGQHRRSTTTRRISAAVSGTGSPGRHMHLLRQIEWNPATRVLKLRNNATLTLSGNMYSFCRDRAAQQRAADRGAARPNTPLKIYIDTPESCGGGTWARCVFRNNSGIVNLNTDPTTLQLHVAGSSDGGDQRLVREQLRLDDVMAVYAPNSTIRMENNLSLIGALAGKQVHMQNNTQLDLSRADRRHRDR